MERPNRIPVRSRQLSLVADREFLDPAVIDTGNRKHTLAALASVSNDFIVLGHVVVRQHHRTGNHRIIHFAVVVRIVIQHDQTIGKLAGDVGIVPAAFFRPKACPMASRTAGNHRHEGIGRRINNRNGPGQGIPGDGKFAVKTHGSLDRESTDRPSEWSTRHIVVTI